MLIISFHFWSLTYAQQKIHFIQIWVSTPNEVAVPFPDLVDWVQTLQEISLALLTIARVPFALKHNYSSTKNLNLHPSQFYFSEKDTVPSPNS